MALDDDEEFEKMCDKCKKKSKIDRCTSCGEVHKERIVNPNFDNKKFEELKIRST